MDVFLETMDTEDAQEAKRAKLLAREKTSAGRGEKVGNATSACVTGSFYSVSLSFKDAFLDALDAQDAKDAKHAELLARQKTSAGCEKEDEPNPATKQYCTRKEISTDSLRIPACRLLAVLSAGTGAGQRSCGVFEPAGLLGCCCSCQC